MIMRRYSQATNSSRSSHASQRNTLDFTGKPAAHPLIATRTQAQDIEYINSAIEQKARIYYGNTHR